MGCGCVSACFLMGADMNVLSKRRMRSLKVRMSDASVGGTGAAGGPAACQGMTYTVIT